MLPNKGPILIIIYLFPAYYRNIDSLPTCSEIVQALLRWSTCLETVISSLWCLSTSTPRQLALPLLIQGWRWFHIRFGLPYGFDLICWVDLTYYVGLWSKLRSCLGLFRLISDPRCDYNTPLGVLVYAKSTKRAWLSTAAADIAISPDGVISIKRRNLTAGITSINNANALYEHHRTSHY